MLPDKPRIGILGAGALGAFYGARLSRSGKDVHFLMRSDWQHVRNAGLEIRSFEGDFHINPPVYGTAEELGPCDLVIISIKSTDNVALPELLRPTVHVGTTILTLQNGLGNEEEILRVLETERLPVDSSAICGGIAFLCSNRIGPGIIHHIDHGWIRLGEFQGTSTARTRQVADLFTGAGIRCEVYESLLRARWEKLVWNIPFNGLGVAARADTAALLSDPELLIFIRELMGEILEAAIVDGVKIEQSLPERMIANTRSMGSYRTSMQIDFEDGRPLEVESILGEPLRRARRGGLNCVRLQSLYALVQRLGSTPKGS